VLHGWQGGREGGRFVHTTLHPDAGSHCRHCMPYIDTREGPPTEEHHRLDNRRLFTSSGLRSLRPLPGGSGNRCSWFLDGSGHGSRIERERTQDARAFGRHSLTIVTMNLIESPYLRRLSIINRSPAALHGSVIGSG
jgi:hypothetical protein